MALEPLIRGSLGWGPAHRSLPTHGHDTYVLRLPMRPHQREEGVTVPYYNPTSTYVVEEHPKSYTLLVFCFVLEFDLDYLLILDGK
jgi:hypothetical protein